MATKILFTSFLIFLFAPVFSQDLGLMCDSISSTETSFELAPMQESFTITINYTGPNPGVKSGVYVTQKAEVEDNGIIESITPPPFGQEKLLTYLWDTQTVLLEVTYKEKIKRIPPDFSVNGKYIIKTGEMSTCELHEIPIVISFSKK